VGGEWVLRIPIHVGCWGEFLRSPEREKGGRGETFLQGLGDVSKWRQFLWCKKESSKYIGATQFLILIT